MDDIREGLVVAFLKTVLKKAQACEVLPNLWI